MKATGLPSIFLYYPYNGHFFIVCETSAFEFLFHDQFILNSWTTFYGQILFLELSCTSD